MTSLATAFSRESLRQPNDLMPALKGGIVLVQPEMERGLSASAIPPLGGDFQGIRVYRSGVVLLKSAGARPLRSIHRLDELAELSPGMVASQQSPSVSHGKIIVVPAMVLGCLNFRFARHPFPAPGDTYASRHHRPLV